MVQFSSKGLSSRATTNYTLSEFNGVDYTTTPTKVTDDKAIKISNYLPEGNSLVKRYGYEKMLDTTVGTLSLEPTPVYDNEEIMEIKLLTVSGKFTAYTGANDETDEVPKDLLLMVYGTRELDNETYIYRGYVDVFEMVYGELRRVNKIEVSDFNYAHISYRCKNAMAFSQDKIYLLAFDCYFEFGYNKDDDEYYLTSLVDSNEDTQGSYVPTLALNYQPRNSLGKSLYYEQLNMLCKRFKVEIGMTYNYTRSPDGDTCTLENGTYDIKALVDKNIVGGSDFTTVNNVTGLRKRYFLVNDTGNSGYEITGTLSNGILTMSIASEKTTIPSGAVKIESDILQDNYGYIKLTFEFELASFPIPEILSAKVGCIFGVNNTTDRIFLGNTDNSPNTDWHTLNDASGKPNYTYFGTETYNAIGRNTSEIIGYSLLNDGSMAILKDRYDVSNIFIRTGKISNTTEQYTTLNYASNSQSVYTYVKSEEYYPTVASGLLIKSITKDTKFVLYDNKLIFNTEDGIYYLNLNATTSNQSYSAKELSYYIRNDLGSDIEGSSMETDGKFLYVARKNKDGQLRIYVADKNEYGFVNAEQQYHWWVLDGIPVYEFKTLNKQLYWIDDDYGLFRFVEGGFSDYNFKQTTSVTIGETVIATDIAFDTNSDKMIIATNSTSWQKLLDIYKYNANIDKNNIGEKLNYIKKNVKLYVEDYGKSAIVDSIPVTYYNYKMLLGESVISSTSSLRMRFRVSNDVAQLYIDIIDYAKKWDKLLQNNNIVYGISRYEISYDGDYTIIDVSINKISDGNVTSTSGSVYLLLNNINIDINELYTSDGKALSDYFYVPGTGWLNATTGEFVATTLNFNMASFKFMGLDINFGGTSYVTNANVIFMIKPPVEAYWYGKYTDFGRYDILKTTKSIHFVPETRRGGYTEVGYRTRKSKSMVSDTTSTYTLSKYIIDIAKERTTLSRYFVSNDLGINLSDIDFNNFSFESDVFARTYSSKKKIKNFSFIQLKFASDTAEDSTIASVDIKYTYGRDNKGVK